MNRFRNKSLRDQYAAMVDALRSRHSGLFTEAGQPPRTSGYALAFWNGLDSVSMGRGFSSRAERSSPAYACWRACQESEYE